MNSGRETKKLSDLCLLSRPARAREGVAPYVEIGDVDIDTKKIISKRKGAVKGSVVATSGSILVSRVRPTRGAIAILEEDSAVSSAFTILKPRDAIDLRLLFYGLAYSDDFSGFLGQKQTGLLYPSVKEGEILSYEISYPSCLREQRRIVGILDNVLANFVIAKAGAEKNLRNANVLFESERDSVLARFGKDWTKSKIEEICTIGDGNHSSNYPKKEDLVEAGVPFIRAKNMVDGRISGHDMRYLSQEKHAQLKKGHLRAGDILVTNRGEIGKTAIVDADYDDANLNSQIAWLRCREGVNNKFLFHALNSGDIQKQFDSSKSGTALQQFTIKQLKALEVPLPPKPKQVAIAKHFDDLLFETQRLANSYKRKLAALALLEKSLLQRALAGNL